MAHWLDKVIEILTSEEVDLRRLAYLAGEDPSTFYRGADLRGADLRGQDLEGLDLSGADLHGAIRDEEVSPLYDLVGNRTFDLGESLSKILDMYCYLNSYTYQAWAIKSVIYRLEEAVQKGYTSPEEVAASLKSLPTVEPLVMPSQGRRRRYRIQLRETSYSLVLQIGEHFSGRRTGFTASLVAGLILTTGRSLRSLPSDFDLDRELRAEVNQRRPSSRGWT